MIFPRHVDDLFVSDEFDLLSHFLSCEAEKKRKKTKEEELQELLSARTTVSNA